jgi:hypothetical protein
MNDLLKMAVEAHGGLSRWYELATVKANVSVTGAIWHLKGKPDALKNISIEAQLHQERITTHFIRQDRRMTFEPNRIVIETETGNYLNSRDNPRDAFQNHKRETPWDDLHMGYFSSYALWNYLTTPFLYTNPGFVTEELAPWHEDGEEWRALKVTFPDYIATHTREQISYFGRDGLLRRHEYTVDIMGGGRGLNYAIDYRKLDGIAVPTKRRIYPSDAERRKVAEPLLIAIDFNNVEFC